MSRAGVIGVGVVALVGAVGVFRWLNTSATGDGPVPIVWDREVCAHCRMHIGEPAFAAQLQTADGVVHNFDDPGCLFEHVQAHPGVAYTAYYRDHDSDGWLNDGNVAFLPTESSPMGYGIKAVRVGTEDARDRSWAEARVASSEGRHDP